MLDKGQNNQLAQQLTEVTGSRVHKNPHTPSSHCSWQKCRLKPINNPNHHYHSVISISICVCLCIRDYKSHLVPRPLRSGPTDRCATKKMVPLVFHPAFYLAPSISPHICRARHIDGDTVSNAHNYRGGWTGHKQLRRGEGKERGRVGGRRKKESKSVSLRLVWREFRKRKDSGKKAKQLWQCVRDVFRVMG